MIDEEESHRLKVSKRAPEIAQCDSCGLATCAWGWVGVELWEPREYIWLMGWGSESGVRDESRERALAVLPACATHLVTQCRARCAGFEYAHETGSCCAGMLFNVFNIDHHSAGERRQPRTAYMQSTCASPART